jgi:SH3-like domain-containing protein
MPSRLAALVLAALAIPAIAGAQTRSGDALPLPRFVSLRAEEVNLRAGPGSRYPVEWVYQRKQLPVEIVAEFEHWRKIRDWQGTEGWVHQSMLTGRRSFIVTSREATLRSRPEPNAPVAARLEATVIGSLIECQPQWCRADAAGVRGWIPRTDFWGAYPRETLK